MLLALFLTACTDIRALAVSYYPQSYEPPAELSVDIQIPLKLTPVATGLSQPTELRFPRQHPNKLVVLQKEGQALILEKQADGSFAAPQPFFRVEVNDRSEQGLLGLAFHPDYAQNGTFYVHATPKSGARRGEISEWSFDPTAPQWKASKKRVILEVPQPYGNHNGGQLQFGADGYLYIAMGDGGWRDDPHDHGQNRQTLLGAMLRISVSPAFSEAYQIPKDNPFVGRSDVLPEVWAYGLRNPWRFVIEGQTAIIADVGQNKYEEVSVAQAGDNLGWNTLEAEHCFLADPCDASQTRLPIWSYDHSMGSSITGGYVIRDGSVLDGWYVFGDFNSGRIWAFPYVKGAQARVNPTLLLKTGHMVVTFGQDSKGTTYLADFASGSILRLDAG